MQEGRLRAAGLVAAMVLTMALPAAVWAQEKRDSFDPDYGSSLAVPDDKWEPSEDPRNGETEVPTADPEAARRMAEYYLKMFGTHLGSPDWIKRSMAVISLGRISNPGITEKLLEVAGTDRSTVVRVFAWEALHARNGSLTAAQRKRWSDAGWALARQSAFRGELRMGLVGLMGAAAPTPETRKVFMKLFSRTNSLDPGDIPTLDAMGAVLARWRDRQLIAALIEKMDRLDDAYRAEYILLTLDADVTPSYTLVEKGSKVMWNRTRAAWSDWYGRQTFGAGKPDPYKGRSALLAPAQTIINSRSAKWRKDLELGRLHLDRFDVAFAIDSTGSMKQVVEWIKRDVTKMMRAFGKISREPRIGVVFYRDRGDEYVTRVHKLTGDGRKLAAAIAATTAKGGGDVPEAVHEALRDVIGKQRWTGSPGAVKIVVLVGDAEPHPESMDRIRRLVTDAAGKGFRFYCVKARTRYGSADLSSFDRIAAWGKGKSFEVWFPAGRPTVGPGRAGVAAPSRVDGPYRQVVGEVLKSVLSAGYHDRAQPFTNVLLEYLEQYVPEKRLAFGPAPPPAPRRRTNRRNDDGRREHRPPPKPYDPQQR